MRQSTSVTASCWHLFSKIPTTIKLNLPIGMWPSVAATPPSDLVRPFLLLKLGIAGKEHHWYLANQKLFVFSSDVTSLPCRVVGMRGASTASSSATEHSRKEERRRNAGWDRPCVRHIPRMPIIECHGKKKALQLSTFLNNLTFRNWFLIHLNCSLQAAGLTRERPS